MNEYLIFEAGDTTVGLAVSHVRQVVRAATLSVLAEGGDEIEGLLNLRGQVVPVICLRAALGIEQPALCDTDFLIVVHDREDRPFAIRSNCQVRLASSDGTVETSESAMPASPRTEGLLRVGSQIVTLLKLDTLAPAASFERKRGDDA